MGWLIADNAEVLDDLDAQTLRNIRIITSRHARKKLRPLISFLVSLIVFGICYYNVTNIGMTRSVVPPDLLPWWYVNNVFAAIGLVGALVSVGYRINNRNETYYVVFYQIQTLKRLRRAMPEWTDSDRRKWVAKSLVNLGAAVAKFPYSVSGEVSDVLKNRLKKSVEHINSLAIELPYATLDSLSALRSDLIASIARFANGDRKQLVWIGQQPDSPDQGTGDISVRWWKGKLAGQVLLLLALSAAVLMISFLIPVEWMRSALLTVLSLMLLGAVLTVLVNASETIAEQLRTSTSWVVGIWGSLFGKHRDKDPDDGSSGPSEPTS